MHKIFAKTSFAGKSVTFLPICHSTNELAKDTYRQSDIQPGHIWLSDYQAKGRGQMGNVWMSEPGKNLLFTLFLTPDFLSAQDQYRINVLVAVVIRETLQHMMPLAKVEIKWPNDIYLNERKVAGILIESILTGKNIEALFCGVGINVNQEKFNGLDTATSILKETQHATSRHELLEAMLLRFEQQYLRLSEKFGPVLEQYLMHLRWRNEWHIFKTNNGTFQGCITGIDAHGRLEMKTSKSTRHFDVKEITYVE